MSEWFYIRIAYGLTWVVLLGYAWVTWRGVRAGEEAVRTTGGGA